LYQGTTLVVPQMIENTSGFRVCVRTGLVTCLSEPDDG